MTPVDGIIVALFRFLVNRMLPAMRAMLVFFEAGFVRLLVFMRMIIETPALATLELDQVVLAHKIEKFRRAYYTGRTKKCQVHHVNFSRSWPWLPPRLTTRR